MTIQFTCTCGKVYQARDELAGKFIKCRGCGQVLRVALASSAPAAAVQPAVPLQPGAPEKISPEPPAQLPTSVPRKTTPPATEERAETDSGSAELPAFTPAPGTLAYLGLFTGSLLLAVGVLIFGLGVAMLIMEKGSRRQVAFQQTPLFVVATIPLALGWSCLRAVRTARARCLRPYRLAWSARIGLVLAWLLWVCGMVATGNGVMSSVAYAFTEEPFASREPLPASTFAAGPDLEYVRSQAHASVVATERISRLLSLSLSVAVVLGGWGLRVWIHRSARRRHGPGLAAYRGLALGLPRWPLLCGGTLGTLLVALPMGMIFLLVFLDQRKQEPIRCLEGHTAAVSSVAFSPDGRRAVSGSHDRSVRLWNVDTGQELSRLDGHTGEVLCVAFAPDGRRVLSGSKDKSVRLWDVEPAAERRRFEEHQGNVTCLAFAPDGRRFLSGSTDETVRLWDADTGDTLRRFEGHRWGVTCVAFLPNGVQFLSADDMGQIRLWDVNTGEEVRRYEKPLSGVQALAVAPDGRQFVSAERDAALRLWAVGETTSRGRFEGSGLSATSVGFCSDGRQVATGNYKEIMLWDVAHLRQDYSFHGRKHDEEISQIAISPDGRSVLSASKDRTLRLWELPAPK